MRQSKKNNERKGESEWPSERASEKERERERSEWKKKRLRLYIFSVQLLDVGSKKEKAY